MALSYILLLLIIFAPCAALLVCLTRGVAAVLKRTGRPVRREFAWTTRRWVWLPCAIFLAVYGSCLAYGAWIEADAVEVTHTEIPVDRPVLGYERFRIVHLSDLHIEGFGTRERRTLDFVRRENPHLILMTGDYLNRASSGADLVEFLRQLDAPHGVFAAPGNWDRKFPMRRLFEAAGMGSAWLDDDWVRIEKDGRELHVIGLDVHPDRRLSEIMDGMSARSTKIVLHHKPEGTDELASLPPGLRADLFLCGHTHGGQVCLPFYGAVVTLSRHGKKYERGLYDFQGTPMYVSRGVGMQGGASPRVRFLARPEVAVIDLVYSPK